MSYKYLLTWKDQVIGGTDTEESARERVDLFRFYDEYNGRKDDGTYKAINQKTQEVIYSL